MSMIITLLCTFLSRRTLIKLYHLYRSIEYRFFNSFPVSLILRMIQPSTDSDSTPPFDPIKPSAPVSFPIKTLEELESRSYFDSFHYLFNKSSVPLELKPAMPDRPRVLVCHDMQGGYGDDKWVQGGRNGEAYSIWHWYLMDVFVYFSHDLITLPPPCWVNTAHSHGVKVLGTVITEWEEGRLICNSLLACKESAHLYAERLAELAVSLGFDGWLINIENQIATKQVPHLIEFVRHLTKTMHAARPGSLVIWYDSVTIDGDLVWQDVLNKYNKPFFDSCDGIFMNYTWKEDYPKLSADVAGDRNYDVYMGIDVFGRNTFGGGQWTTNNALDVIKESNVSAAIFAPGWVYETGQPPDFPTAQNRWWDLVKSSWGKLQSYPKTLPFYSNFDQGRGYHVSSEGYRLSDAPWNNMSCQGIQPILEFTEAPSSETIKVLADLEEDSYNGGGNITFRGTLVNSHITTRLFHADLLLDDSPVQITYSVKSGASSLFGLLLHFSSSRNDEKRLLLASWGVNDLSSLLDGAVLPYQVVSQSLGYGWTTNEASITMKGYTLTEIEAVCYKPDLNPHRDPADYFSVLGHITMRNAEQRFCFPQSSSWLIDGSNVEKNPGPLDTETQTLSAKIVWKLKHGDPSMFRKFNIFVEKTIEKSWGDSEVEKVFLGVANVYAFYISDLVISPGTSSVKIIIQATAADGTSQKLDECPFFQLNVEGQ